MIVDLHCHSTASDGELTPAALLARARQQGVVLCSITDHDTVAAYRECPVPHGMRLLPGVELSCVWGGVSIHLIGLDVGLETPTLDSALSRLARAREERALAIDRKLARLGIVDTYPGARRLAVGRAIGRPDFARHLCERGTVDTPAQAFDRYLGAGKAGDVKMHWPAMTEMVECIRASGGVAVLAHPFQYKMTSRKLRRLIADFREAGGEAMEVVNGNPRPDQLDQARRLCRQFGLEASAGSDFHRPTPWNELGCDPQQLGDCPPVWHRWS